MSAAQELRAELEADHDPAVAGPQRVIIENVSPEVDGGRFPIKRTPGEPVLVTADIFADGHDVLAAVVLYRHESEKAWSESLMEPGVNDQWVGSFLVTKLGNYYYNIEGWVDHFSSWRRGVQKKAAAGQEVSVDLLGGAVFFREAAGRTVGDEARRLEEASRTLADESASAALRVEVGTDPVLAELLRRYSGRRHASRYARELRVVVDPELARFSAWYELFPRSCSAAPGQHGTLRDVERLLPRIADMGFDVVYLPPIHPIGRSFRKGRNNSLVVGESDPGSPWAIGSAEGGHKTIHPQLGSIADFGALVARARSLRLEIALDIAFQCSPDHPYVREHPEWFQQRANGTIQYAENPPKKYQDIYPLNFESSDWRSLWIELKSVFEFWIGHGVRIFRVDNPHTKSFRFWEWCLKELKERNPETIFLSEAFTRPKVMYYLAKLGFTQSYNYFPWRNTAHELREYLTEITQGPAAEFFRPSLWPNTPDILPEYLQYGGRPAFIVRFVLAATLGASYGIYGPPYEFPENTPRDPGSEEYLNSEKYEVRHWDWSQPGGLGELMTAVNRIRRENRALQNNGSLRFHRIDNPQMLAYSKSTEDGSEAILVVVNLDPHHTQRGWVTLEFDPAKDSPRPNYQAHDLLTNDRYLWQPGSNYVELSPQFVPAHILRLRRFLRTEHDFDYFL